MQDIDGTSFSSKEIAAIIELGGLLTRKKRVYLFDCFSDPPADLGRFAEKLEEAQAIKKHYEISTRIDKKFPTEVWSGQCSAGDNLQLVVAKAKNPDRDYFAEWNRWIKGRWWSVPIYIAVWSVPFLAGWALAIKRLLAWFGLSEI